MTRSSLIVGLSALLAGCAGSPQKDTTAHQEVEFEELRINARAKEGGGYEFDSYDAGDLFKRATDSLNAKKCEEAVSLYDKLTTEFPSSEYVSASLYNAGLCQQALGDFAGAA